MTDPAKPADGRAQDRARLLAALDQLEKKLNSAKRRNHWKIVREAIILVLAACALVAAVAQWRVFEKQNSDFEDQEVRQLQAYVHADPGEIVIEQNSDGSFDFGLNPSLTVSGQTPAADVSVQWGVRVENQQPDATYRAFPYLQKNTRGYINAYPNQKYPVGAKFIHIAGNDLAMMNLGKGEILVLGTVFYRDVFKKPRWSNFCFGFNWQQALTKTPRYCKLHNDADWSPQAGDLDPARVLVE